MTPETEADLADLIAGCDAPTRIVGGGTRGIECAGQTLGVNGLQGITLYEPGALTLVAQAGTPLSDIQATLKAEGQRLAFEPMDHRPLLGTLGEPTIGGIVAGNISGPRRIQAGACRDFLLGVRYVDGAGQVVSNGGRVMKNVTGYDLVKLMAGSFGTLGVLSEVSLKVLPDVETAQTLAIPVSDTAQAVRVMSAALGSPYDVSGAAYDPTVPAVYLRLEGFEDSVTYRAGQLQRDLAAHAEVELLGEAHALWTSIRDVEAFADQVGDVWRISVKPSDAPEIAARCEANRLMHDWGGGLIWALVDSGTDLRARLGDYSGHATLVRASTATVAALGRFEPQPGIVGELSKKLRAQFDPRGIFNTGLMG